MNRFRTQTFNVIIISFMASLLIVPGASAAEVTSEDPLLNMLPENCMFCLRVNNFNDSLGKLDQYMAGAMPIPVSLAMLVNLQLGAAIGDPMLTGIDLGGDFSVFAIPPQADGKKPAVGILVPVNSYTDFIKTNPNCKPAEGGLTLLAPPNSTQGSFILAPAGNQYALVVHEMEKDSMPSLQKALTGDSKISKHLSSDQANSAASAPLWTYVNLAGIYDKYNKDALAGIDTLKQGMVKEMQTAPAQMAGMGGVIEFYIDILPKILEKIGGGMDSATVALIPEPTNLSLDIAVRAKDGTDLEGIFAKNPEATGSYTMAGYLDNNNAVNGLAKMNIPAAKKMYDLFFDIIKNTDSDSKLKEQLEQFKTSLDKTYDAMGDEVAFSFSYAGGKPPFKFHEIVETKKTDVMREYMETCMVPINEIYNSMGIPMELIYNQDAATYKNVPIDTLSISMVASNDPNTANMQKEFEKIYGTEAFKYYFAQSPDKFYMVMGPDGENTLKALIDRPASGTPSGDIKTALDTLENTSYNDFVCSVNFIKLVNGFNEMVKTMVDQPCMPLGPMLSDIKDVPTKSCLVIGGKIGDGQVGMRLALPKQHLIEIIAVVNQIQQKIKEETQSQTTAPSVVSSPQDSAAIQEQSEASAEP